MEKTCFKCEQTLPVEQFYAHPEMADGRLGKCKECTRRDVRSNRAARVEYYRAFDRNRPNADERAERNRAYLQTEQGRAFRRQASVRWDRKNAEKKRAHLRVRRAKASGKITQRSCATCGDPKTQAHHPDYSKPLDVVWLCSRHHAEHHKQLRRAA